MLPERALVAGEAPAERPFGTECFLLPEIPTLRGNRMAEPSAFERLVAADEKGTGLTLDAHEVYELVADFVDMDLARELDNHLAYKCIERLTGFDPGKPN